MRTQKFFCFLVFGCFVGAANAARLDVDHTTEQDEFSATFGTYFQSGLNKSGRHQTDFGAGRMDIDALILAYTPTKNLTINLAVGENDYSDAQIGVQYKLVKRDIFNLDFMTDYGPAWTTDSDGGGRFGNNNVDFGLRAHGNIFHNIQLALATMGQYVWADENFWNINLTAQMMFYFTKHLALDTEFDFNFLQIGRPSTWYDKELRVGLVYNITEMSAINPFVTYHFKTKDFQTEYVSYYDFWKIGMDISVQF